MIKKYVKKPIEVEAVQWTGDNAKEIQVFVKGFVFGHEHDKNLFIVTFKSGMNVNIGDYIIKGVNGGFYSCKPDIFKKTYEVEE